jgi:predicted ATP-dependent serine protease
VEEPVIATSEPENLPIKPIIPYKTSNSFFDDFTPGGIPEGTTSIIYGNPGTRKSYISLQWSSLYVQSGLKCIYFSNEMYSQEIDHYVQTLGIQEFSPLFIYQEDVITIHRIIKKERPQVLFLDSYQKLRADSGYGRSPSANDDLVKHINIFAEKYGCIVFVISHKIIPVGLEHDVKIVFKCSSINEDSNIIKFATTKNRLSNSNGHIAKFFKISHQVFEEVFPEKPEKNNTGADQ